MSKSQIFNGIKRLSDIVIKSGKGCRLTCRDSGKEYLDFTAGIGVVSTGHCHPTVVAAVQEQATQVVHAQQSVGYSAKIFELIERMEPIVPKGLDSFFFANSGAEAVEGAVRLARQVTGKDNIICFNGGYHGRTLGTLALTSSGAGYRGNRLGPSPAGTFWVPYPYEHLGSHRSSQIVMEDLESLLLTHTPPCETAAVLIEPVLGEGGYVPAPFEFMRALRAYCDKHDILLIADEVQSGYGRTGAMFAVEHSEVTPDVLVTAKGLASGYPLSAVVTRKDLSDAQVPGSMGGTYGGNAVAVAAAIATLDVFEAENILENVHARGAQLMRGLHDLAQGGAASGRGAITDVRGLGLMNAVEFEPTDTGVAGAVSKACFDRGMLLMTTGTRQTLRFMPPLTVSEAEVDECLDILGSAMADVQASA